MENKNMKNPTSNGNDLYQVGNDYAQEPAIYFNLSSYKDGIYTELASGISGTIDPAGINKRILAVLPQTEWAEPATSGFEDDKYLSDDYATAIVKTFPVDEDGIAYNASAEG